MRSIYAISALAALMAAGSACAQKSAPADTTSTVEGKLTVSSFAAAPTGVDAIDEKGVRTHTAIGEDGAFRLSLDRAHVYKLVVIGPKGEEPIVFPRTGGRLDRTFRISSGAAAVALGAVRHLGGAPAGGFSIKSSTKPASANGQQGDGQPGECVDGVVMGTNTPCVDDDHNATCEQGSETSDGDGECKDGKDAKTGQPCTDTDNVGDEEDADPNQAMAVPEVNPPNDVSGCNEGGDNENDGEGND